MRASTAMLNGAAATAALLFASCSGEKPMAETGESTWNEQHDAMVRHLSSYYGLRDERILKAMRSVRRHRFIPETHRRMSDPYGDHPCPIGHGQTISQPYIVAYMTERMGIQPGEKVLEVGTGSGYQAAILAELGAEVYSIEIVPPLAAHARQVLAAEGYGKIRVRTGDGYQGWPEFAPFDAVIVTCAPEEVPPELVRQLRDGGRMILPLGVGAQRLVILRKKGSAIEQEADLPVRFVPMIRGRGDSPGAAGDPSP